MLGHKASSKTSGDFNLAGMEWNDHTQKKLSRDQGPLKSPSSEGIMDKYVYNIYINMYIYIYMYICMYIYIYIFNTATTSK